MKGGVTWVSIPVDNKAAVFAGLLTINIPLTVKIEQEYNIMVRRVGKRLYTMVDTPLPSGPPEIPKVEEGRARGREREYAHAIMVQARAAEIMELEHIWERYIARSF
jgi:hypothetical protein